MLCPCFGRGCVAVEGLLSARFRHFLGAMLDDRIGAKPEATHLKHELRLSAVCGHSCRGHPTATPDLSRCSYVPEQSCGYSITSSARSSSHGRTVRPSALAVLRLMLRWKSVGCSNGGSAGLAPFKMRSIK